MSHRHGACLHCLSLAAKVAEPLLAHFEEPDPEADDEDRDADDQVNDLRTEALA